VVARRLHPCGCVLPPDQEDIDGAATAAATTTAATAAAAAAAAATAAAAAVAAEAKWQGELLLLVTQPGAHRYLQTPDNV
jgi:ADP-ribosylglycohydrolase